MADISRELETQGYNIFIRAFTGESPEINRYDEYNELILSDKQIQIGQSYFRDMLESAPGEVRISNSKDIFVPVITAKYWGWAAGLLVLGGVIGMLVKK